MAALVACAPVAPATSPAPVAAGLGATIDSLIDGPETREARWGVLVVDARTGDTLYSRDASKLFLPASNMKVVTAAIALDALGPQHRFATRIHANGGVRDSVLHGDLLVEGGGDPGISDHVAGDAMIPLRAIADSVASRGITRIAGTVRPHGDRFPDANLGFEWAWEDLESTSGAPVGELLFNEGFSEIVVVGTAAGSKPSVSTRPARTFPKLRVEAVAIAPSARDTVSRVRSVKDTVTSEVVVSGTVLVGDTVTIDVTHRDPGAAYIAALREALRDRGIGILDATLPTAGTPRELFAVSSEPLHRLLGHFMKPSQNQIGEMLLKSVAHAVTDTGTATVGKRIFSRKLADWGAKPNGYIVHDGSGLSRRNLLSPETLVRVLQAMAGHRHAMVFFDAMPIAGVDGTLRTRMRGTAGDGNAHAKTGTLSNVRTLSGYVTRSDGGMLIFSIMTNNYIAPTARISAIQDAIVAALAKSSPTTARENR